MAVIGLLVLDSCRNKPEPCKITNKIFNSFSPDSKEYKDELAKQLETVDKSKLTFWIDSYWQKVRKDVPVQEYMQVHINGKDLCADMVLTIKDSKKGIEEVLEKKLMGYSNAELEDLKYEVVRDSSGTQFIFKEVSAVSL